SNVVTDYNSFFLLISYSFLCILPHHNPNTESYTLSLHDALPICCCSSGKRSEHNHHDRDLSACTRSVKTAAIWHAYLTERQSSGTTVRGLSNIEQRKYQQ